MVWIPFCGCFFLSKRVTTTELRDLWLNLPTDYAQIGPRYWKSVPSLVSSSPNLYSEPALWIRNEVWLPASLAFELPQVSLLDSSNRWVLQHFTVMVSCFLVGYLLRLSLNLVYFLSGWGYAQVKTLTLLRHGRIQRAKTAVDLPKVLGRMLQLLTKLLPANKPNQRFQNLEKARELFVYCVHQCTVLQCASLHLYLGRTQTRRCWGRWSGCKMCYS